MTDLLTTLASGLLVLLCFDGAVTILIIPIIIVFFAFMLLKLATRLVSSYLTTAPPHVYFISLKHIPMCSATPIEIILFIIFFATIFTSFLL